MVPKIGFLVFKPLWELCQCSLQVFILSWVIGWGRSLAKTFLSRLKMLLVNDTEDTKSLLSYRGK